VCLRRLGEAPPDPRCGWQEEDRQDAEDPPGDGRQHGAARAQAALQEAEGQGAEGGAHLEDQEDDDQLAGGQVQLLGGVDADELDDDLQAGHVDHEGDQEAKEDLVAPRQRPGGADLCKPGLHELAEAGALEAGDGAAALAHEDEGGDGGDDEEDADHQHRALVLAQEGLVGLGRIGADGEHDEAEAQQAAEVAQTPAQARDRPHVVFGGEIRQEAAAEALAQHEGRVADRQQPDGQRHIPRPDEVEPQGRGRAHQRRIGQVALLAAAVVADRPRQRRQQQRQHRGGHDRDRPVGVPRLRALRDDVPGEEGRVHHRDHHGRIAGVGEVIHRPAEDLPLFYRGERSRGQDDTRARLPSWVWFRVAAMPVTSADSAQDNTQPRRPAGLDASPSTPSPVSGRRPTGYTFGGGGEPLRDGLGGGGVLSSGHQQAPVSLVCRLGREVPCWTSQGWRVAGGGRRAAVVGRRLSVVGCRASVGVCRCRISNVCGRVGRRGSQVPADAPRTGRHLHRGRPIGAHRSLQGVARRAATRERRGRRRRSVKPRRATVARQPHRGEADRVEADRSSLLRYHPHRRIAHPSLCRCGMASQPKSSSAPGRRSRMWRQ
jgi:hypothetical protein